MNEWMNFIQKVPGWHSSICTLSYINRECFCWWNTGEKLLVALTAPSCYRKVPTGKTQQKALWGDSHSYLCCQWGLAESACFWTRMFGSVFGESRGKNELGMCEALSMTASLGSEFQTQVSQKFLPEHRWISSDDTRMLHTSILILNLWLLGLFVLPYPSISK